MRLSFNYLAQYLLYNMHGIPEAEAVNILQCLQPG